MFSWHIKWGYQTITYGFLYDVIHGSIMTSHMCFSVTSYIPYLMTSDISISLHMTSHMGYPMTYYEHGATMTSHTGFPPWRQWFHDVIHGSIVTSHLGFSMTSYMTLPMTLDISNSLHMRSHMGFPPWRHIMELPTCPHLDLPWRHTYFDIPDVKWEHSHDVTYRTMYYDFTCSLNIMYRYSITSHTKLLWRHL